MPVAVPIEPDSLLEWWFVCFRPDRPSRMGKHRNALIDVHPLIWLDRWNEGARHRTSRGEAGYEEVVLTFYERVPYQHVRETLLRAKRNEATVCVLRYLSLAE